MQEIGNLTIKLVRQVTTTKFAKIWKLTTKFAKIQEINTKFAKKNSQNHVSNIHIMWQELDLELCKKPSQTHLVFKTIEEISAYIFISFTCVEISPKH